jgi:anti-anti-sigma factor
MPIEKWSEEIVLARLSNDPQISDDLDGVEAFFRDGGRYGVLDFSAVTFLNSSNLAHLLRIRKQMILATGRMVLCGLSDEIWGAFLVTSMDKVFEFSDDVATSLATLQLAGTR